MSLALFGMIPAGDFFDATVGTAPCMTTAAVVSISIYVTGRRRLRRGGPRAAMRFPGWRLGSFVLGWLGLLAAIATPRDAAAERTLSAHMILHMLLALVVPPLWWFGAPAMPMLMGLPR
ncbi:MAG: cytochrome c oxidase assembly protein, partial [Planctomycetota bacterium]